MKDLDPATLIGVLAILLLSLSWHEAAHAWVADKRGDPTARQLGRVTLNPLKHLDLFLSVLLPIAMFMATGYAFGGGKPVPINVNNFKNRARDFMLVAIAGPASNLLLAVGFALAWAVAAWTGLLPAERIPNPYGPDNIAAPTMLDLTSPLALHQLLITGVMLNLLLALFNMVPLPPLDGSRVVGWLLPSGLQRYWYSLDRIGIFLVLLLVFYFEAGTLIFRIVLRVYVALAQQVDAFLATRLMP